MLGERLQKYADKIETEFPINLLREIQTEEEQKEFMTYLGVTHFPDKMAFKAFFSSLKAKGTLRATDDELDEMTPLQANANKNTESVKKAEEHVEATDPTDDDKDKASAAAKEARTAKVQKTAKAEAARQTLEEAEEEEAAEQLAVHVVGTTKLGGWTYSRWSDEYIGTRYHGVIANVNKLARFPLDDVDDGFPQDAARIRNMDNFVPEPRDPLCKSHAAYPKVETLPDTSVIIAFRNEYLPVLIRSVITVLNRTPKHLLREIILVDDASDREGLGDELDRLVAGLPKVHLIRLPERKGIANARTTGFLKATGATLTIMDSHVEVAEGWAEPLLARVQANPNILAMPIIATIQGSDYEYDHVAGIVCSGFKWDLQYTSISAQPQDNSPRKTNIDPIPCPAQAGGMWTMDRIAYFKYGGYDLNMYYWGGENLEMSLRLSMCGARMEAIPCSHIYHVFRAAHTAYSVDTTAVEGNTGRIAEVWLDPDYADAVKLIFASMHKKFTNDTNGIAERKQLRKDLNCKSFQWYLKNIYPTAHGDAYKGTEHMFVFTNKASGKCLDAGAAMKANRRPEIHACHYFEKQIWTFIGGSLRHVMWPSLCVDVYGKHVSYVPCPADGSINAVWSSRDGGSDQTQLVHRKTKKCLTAAQTKKNMQTLSVAPCDATDENQIWSMEKASDHHNP